MLEEQLILTGYKNYRLRFGSAVFFRVFYHDRTYSNFCCIISFLVDVSIFIVMKTLLRTQCPGTSSVAPYSTCCALTMSQLRHFAGLEKFTFLKQVSKMVLHNTRALLQTGSVENYVISYSGIVRVHVMLSYTGLFSQLCQRSTTIRTNTHPQVLLF